MVVDGWKRGVMVGERGGRGVTHEKRGPPPSFLNPPTVATAGCVVVWKMHSVHVTYFGNVGAREFAVVWCRDASHRCDER